MLIGKARLLKYGDKVRCPADRGDPAYIGTVRSNDCADIGAGVNIYGAHYIWVSVQWPGKDRRTVWPSNRIERA